MVKSRSLLWMVGWLCLLPSSGRAESERQATSPASIRVADGFQVELLRSARDGEDSWISLSIDATGRIFLGLDSAGAAVLEPAETTDDGPSGDTFSFRRLTGTDDLKHCRGILATHEALYVVATDSQQVVRLFDRDSDGTFEERQTLAELPYASRYGHGMNQLVEGPDGGLFLVIGNDVQRPAMPAATSPYLDPREDWMLPSPHDLGHDDRVGYVVRFTAETTGAHDGTWEVLAGGFRNPFDLAFNRDGECFTWDADMEWDAGLPWYRPTRLNHVVAGGEYGWRWGSGKWPTFFADSLPSTLDTGFASPTGMLFGYDTDWPDRYRDALFMADWQHGRMLLVDLVPQGSTYTATADVFLEGSPLNICDMAIGPDQAMYFITGGRGSQSGLYRVTWTGERDDPEPNAINPAATAVAAASRQTRHRLEDLQRDPDPAELWFITSHLDSPDRWLRTAARVALERLPTSLWQDLPQHLDDPQAQRTASLALARQGSPDMAASVRTAALAADWSTLSPDALAETLRTLELSLLRQGPPSEVDRDAMLARLAAIDPKESFAVSWLAGELLVALESEQAIEWLLQGLSRAATQEEQIQFAKSLSRVEQGWTQETAGQVISWLASSRGMPGGRLVETAWQNLRSDFQQAWSAELLASLEAAWAKLDGEWSGDGVAAGPARPFVRAWTVDEVLAEVTTNEASVTSQEQAAGLSVLASAGCLTCHRYGDRGTHTGPELTHVGRRLDARALLESILEPSRQIDPKYALATLLLDDGTVITGRAVGVNSRDLTIEINPVTAETVIVSRERIEQSLPTVRSPMPEGLLNGFTAEEILNLLALLRTPYGSSASTPSAP
jgi:putative heme-binding domain-containing protein